MLNHEDDSCGMCSGVGSFKVRNFDGWGTEPCPCAKDNQEQMILKQLAQDKTRLQTLEQEIEAIKARTNKNIELLGSIKARH